MSQFLDKTGLSHFWDKAKIWIGNHYYGKQTGVSISEKTVKITEDSDITTVSHTGVTNIDMSTSDIAYVCADMVKVTNTQTPGKASVMDKDHIESPKIQKVGGTSNQVLLADGNVAALDEAGGIPTLNPEGKIDAEKLGIDTKLFEVVRDLPTSLADINKSKIYITTAASKDPNGKNNYAEYVYIGKISGEGVTYDETKWEKLGEYKSDVDLSGYVKNTDTATASKNGVMSASDKKGLDTLLNRYPLNIATFTASPNLVEVGASADITFAWTLGNTDFHPVTSQSIVVDGAAAVTVANGTLNYKKTGLAGATSAIHKKAILTINGYVTKEVNISYHYPTYVGVVAQGTTMDATAIQKLTKSIEWGRGITKSLTQNNQVIVYAYPASYGDLTSIKDRNGFDGIGGYTKSVVAINSISYNVYVQKLPATVSNGAFTFA